jgi:type I restriction enzyme S subunit
VTLAELTECCGGEVRTGPFGSQLHKADYVEDKNATPVVMPKDMIDGRIDVTSIARIDGDARDRLSQHVLSAGDIVLARRGDIGRRAWVGDAESGWLCGTGSMRISLRSCRRIRARYLYYYLATTAAVGWLEGHAVGATMSNLSAGVVEQLPVEFPDVVDQDVIVGILDSITRLIENNRRRIEILEEMARLIYREWFVHFRFPGHADVELVDSDLGPLPEGWQAATLGEVSENFDRLRKPLSKTERSEMQGDFPYYGAAKIVDHVNDWIFDGEYLLFAEDGTVVTSDGFPVLQLVNEKFWVNNHTHILQGDGLPTRFLWLAVADYPISGHMTGAAQPKITQANLRRVPVVRPEAAVVNRFVKVINPMVDLLQTLSRMNNLLSEARDLLLPRLISGELDVSDLDLDLEAVA